MSNTQNHLKEFLVTLSENQVSFIVCGGVAAILHGVPRVTLDLDISVEWSKDNLVRLIRTMDQLGLEPKVPIPAEALLEPDVIREMVENKGALVFTFLDPQDTLRHIDVFLTKELSYDVLMEHTEFRQLDNYKVRLLDVDYLLQLKEQIDPPRDKDMLDIKTLRKISEQSDD